MSGPELLFWLVMIALAYQALELGWFAEVGQWTWQTAGKLGRIVARWFNVLFAEGEDDDAQ